MINIKWSIEDDRNPGGQSCGKTSVKMVGKSEDLGIEIKCKCFKSQHKNREFIEDIYKYIEEKLQKQKP